LTVDAWSDLPVDASTPVFASVYDPNGNALTITDPSGTRTFTYDATNRIEILAGPSGITTFTYDDSGQLLKKQAPMGATTTYTWDGDGRLIKAELPGSFVFTMVYDCQGMLAMVPLEPTVAGLRQLPTGQTTLALYVGVPPGSPIFRNAYTAATRTPPFPSSRTIRSSAGFNSSSFRFPADIAPANRTTHSSSASACAITAVPRGSHNGCNPSTQFARVTASPLLNCPCNSATAFSSTSPPALAAPPPPPAPCPAHPNTAIANTAAAPPTNPRFMPIPHRSNRTGYPPPNPPFTQRPAPPPAF
jgi:YD repeat-containing protein